MYKIFYSTQFVKGNFKISSFSELSTIFSKIEKYIDEDDEIIELTIIKNQEKEIKKL